MRDLSLFGRGDVGLAQPPGRPAVSEWMKPTSEEEIELDRRWREAFNQPLPMLGAPDIARAILDEHMAKAVGGNGNAPRS